MDQSATRQNMKNRLQWMVIVGVFVAALVVSLWWFLRPDAPNEFDIPSTLNPEVRERAVSIEKQWRSADFLSVDGPDASSREIRESFTSRILDPNGLLTDRMRESLLNSLATQIKARTEPEASAYLSAMQTDPAGYTLADPASDNFAKARSIFAYEFGAPPDGARTSGEILRQLWRQCMSEKGFRFKEIGRNLENGVVLVRRFRVQTELLDSAVLEMPEESRGLLSAPLSARAAVFHLSPVASQSYLQDRPAAIGANVHVLVRCHNDLMMNWMTDWWWDENRGVWICERMGWKSARVMRVFF